MVALFLIGFRLLAGCVLRDGWLWLNYGDRSRDIRQITQSFLRPFLLQSLGPSGMAVLNEDEILIENRMMDDPERIPI